VLTRANALIGQNFTDLIQLEQVFTPAQIYQLALDRTRSQTITGQAPAAWVSLQFTHTRVGTQTGAQPASAVSRPCQPPALPLTYQAATYSSNSGTGRFQRAVVPHGNTEIGRMTRSASTHRFPLGGAWRLGRASPSIG